MPAKSGAQYRLMAASCHGASSKVPSDVACEFVHKTPASERSRFMKQKRRIKKMNKTRRVGAAVRFVQSNGKYA